MKKNPAFQSQPPFPWELELGVFLCICTLLLLSCGTMPPDDILEKSGPTALVFVKENSREDNRSNAMRSNADEYYPGSDICILSPISPQGEITNLTAQYTQANQSQSRNYGAVADPEISYDGKKILFAMRENRGEHWHIYEMNLDGGDLTKLSDQTDGDDMDPIYLPNGQIIFTSTRPGIVDEYERRGSPLLHVADRQADGRLINIRRISFNQSHDTNPIVHSSGKIFYSRWEHLGNPNKFPLFVINPDGTRPFVMYGNHSPSQSGSRVFLEARELTDGGIVCSVMERNSPFEGGAIAIIDISKSDDNLTFITPPSAPFNNTNQSTSALFKTPHPIIDKNASNNRKEKILVAMSPIPINENGGGEVDYGIYIMDKDGKNLRLIYNDPDYNEIDPVPAMPRDKIPGGVPQALPPDPNVVNGIANGQTTGMFFDGNVYDRASNDGQIRPDPSYVNKDGSIGQAKYFRILEAVPLPRNSNRRGGEIGNTNFEKQRVVGYASIRTDGSFSVEVPADKSLHMQVLDENGCMLVNQLTWVQVMPGEQRLCTGCHDSHSRDKIINDLEIQANLAVLNKAEGRTYQSGFNNAENVMLHPSATTDTLDFFDRLHPNRINTVQATFDSKCVSCHSASSPAGGLRLEMLTSDLVLQGENDNGETSVYELLTDGNGYTTAQNNNIDYVTQNGARRSPLIWIMFGKQLNSEGNSDYRPLSYDHTQLWQKDQYNQVDPFLPANSQLLKMIEWIDAGIQYSNTVND
jgi:hypothetical protein